jgi:hypothetical protein
MSKDAGEARTMVQDAIKGVQDALRDSPCSLEQANQMIGNIVDKKPAWQSDFVNLNLAIPPRKAFVLERLLQAINRVEQIDQKTTGQCGPAGCGPPRTKNP